MKRYFSLLFLCTAFCISCKKNTYPDIVDKGDQHVKVSPIDSFLGVYNGITMHTHEEDTQLPTGEWQYTYDTSYSPYVFTIGKVSIDSFRITSKDNSRMNLVLKYDSTNKYFINTTTGGHTGSGINITIIPAENRLLFRDHWQYGSYSYAEYDNSFFDGKK